MDLLGELADAADFKTVVVLPESRWKDGTPQDYVLRFFAFLERYQLFAHSVDGFLKDYTEHAHNDPEVDARRKVFTQTFRFLAQCFPNGLKGRKGQTPVNLFEGVAVGCAFALDQSTGLKPTVNPDWIKSEELHRYVTGPTNSRPRVRGRVEYCRDRFLHDNA
jgi:hypothetical protein